MKRTSRPRWGQNFLVHIGTAQRILQQVTESGTDAVVEIGPGRGALTRGLLTKARRVVAIEKDRLLAEELRAELGTDERLVLIEGDALDLSWKEVVARASEGAPDCTVRFVANLPYDVGTILVLRWLEACAQEPRLGEAIVMLQAEVVDRLGGRPGTKEYGSLGAITQCTHVVRHVIDVAPSCFKPAPKVWSRVVHVKRRAEPAFPLENWSRVAGFIHAAFAQRRKQLAPALAGRFGRTREDWRAALAACGLREDSRAEGLSPEQLAALLPPMG